MTCRIVFYFNRKNIGMSALLEEPRVSKSIVVSLDHDGKGRYREGNHNGIPTSVAECLNT